MVVGTLGAVISLGGAIGGKWPLVSKIQKVCDRSRGEYFTQN